jgi:ankyrin repeat protein
LLAAKADARIADAAGWTALHFAAQERQAEIAKLLLDAGAEVDAQDQNGNTPLWRAVFATKDDPELIRFLLAAGADKKRKNKNGVSPLSQAKESSNPDKKKWLGG